MENWKPDVRPKTEQAPKGEAVCGHGYGYGHGCKDCAGRTYLANFGWGGERSVAELPKYSEMLGASSEIPFEELTVAGQRDELLAAVAFLMPMVQRPYSGSGGVPGLFSSPQFGPEHYLRERYGIGMTGLEKQRAEDDEAAAEEATWD